MYILRFRQQPAEVPSNSIGKPIAAMVPRGTPLHTSSYVDQEGDRWENKTFDTDGDSDVDVSYTEVFEKSGPDAQVKYRFLSINAPGRPYYLAGGHSFAAGANGVIYNESIRTPHPTDPTDGSGELWMTDNDRNGVVDEVGRWGTALDVEMDASVYTPDERENAKTLTQTDTNGDGKLEQEEVRNMFMPPTFRVIRR